MRTTWLALIIHPGDPSRVDTATCRQGWGKRGPVWGWLAEGADPESRLVAISARTSAAVVMPPPAVIQGAHLAIAQRETRRTPADVGPQ
jgi:hypothetical protein